MKNIIAAFILLMLALSASQAQTPVYKAEIEVDPIAYVLNGYSLHGIVLRNNLRFDAGVFGIEQPKGYSGNEDFSTYSHGFGFKLNYLLDKKQTWFTGIGLGFVTNDVTFDPTGEVNHQKVIGIGIHGGYRWYVFGKSESAWRKLYIAPWVSFDLNKSNKDITVNTKTYSQPVFSIFPTIHVGYRF